MRFGNCMLHALWRWCRDGGCIIFRRSPFGPYPHGMQTPNLPEDLPVSQFVSDDETIPWWHIFFWGHVEHQVGHIKAPPVKGRVDWINTIYVLAVIGSVVFTVAYAIKHAITLFV